MVLNHSDRRFVMSLSGTQCGAVMTRTDTRTAHHRFARTTAKTIVPRVRVTTDCVTVPHVTTDCAASRPAERCPPHQPPCGRALAPRFCRWGRGEPVSGCRCARGRAHVAEQMWQRVSPVPMQMWYGPCPRSRFLRGRCGLAAVGPQLAELGSGLERVLCSVRLLAFAGRSGSS